MKCHTLLNVSFALLLAKIALPALLNAQECRYLGRPLPGDNPVRFAAEPFLATSQWFWHGTPTFSPDGTEMFFVKYLTASNRTQIWYSACENGVWSIPQAAPFSSGTYSDNNPVFAGSKNVLYFQSERPVPALYKVTRTMGIWSAPVILSVPLPAGTSLGKQFSLSGNGNLYAELSAQADNDTDIYCWKIANGQFQNPVKLMGIGTSAYDGFPKIDRNERFILFSSNRSGGQGGFDIYLSYLQPDGSWTVPENLGPLYNSTGEEAWTTFSPDGNYLFFTAGRSGDNGFNPYWVDAEVIYSRIPKTPYMGQPLPGRIPEKFAPGTVSSGDLREYSLTLSSDSTELYFYRFSEEEPSRLFVSWFEQGSWCQPEEFLPTRDYPASEPCMTPDNQRLYFMWKTSESGIPPYYLIERTRTGWSEPVEAGQGMYLTSDSLGNLYTTDVSQLFSTGRTYLASIALNKGLFSRLTRLDVQPHYGDQAHPCISPDGSYLLFDVNGGQHLFVSFRKADGSWSNGIDLADHGFDPKAGGAYLSPDGKFLFFHLDGDIWWVDSQVIRDLNPLMASSTMRVMPGVELYQPFPNPMRGQTGISFYLEFPDRVTLDLYNSVGRKMKGLINSQLFPAGEHSVRIDMSGYAAGIYCFTLTTGGGRMLSRKAIVEG